jgi:NitT/TauT family transport system substrate-binding protein
VAVLLAACTTAPTAPPAAKPAAPAQPAAPGAAAPAARPASAAVQPLSPPVKVKLGDIAIVAEAGYFVALEKGYFAEEGLEVELVPFQRSGDMIPALATGELQFGSITLDSSLFNAVLRDIELKIISYNSLLTPTHYTAGLIVRQDLLDSGRYREPKDLKGMTIGLPGLGSTPQFYAERILASGGLAGEDATFAVLGFPDMVTAFANKAIDAAWLVEPFVAIVQAQGLAKNVIPSGDVHPGAVTMVLLVSPVFAQDNPEAVRRFATAFLRGQRDYYRAYVQNEGDKDEIVRMLVAHTAIKDPGLYARMGMHAVDPNGGMDARSLDEYQDFFVRVGTQQRKVDLNRLVDRAYVDYALQRLGRVP